MSTGWHRVLSLTVLGLYFTGLGVFAVARHRILTRHAEAVERVRTRLMAIEHATTSRASAPAATVTP